MRNVGAIVLAATVAASAVTQATYVRAATKYDGAWSTVGHIRPFKAVSLRRPFPLICATIAPSVSTWEETQRGLSSLRPSKVAISEPFGVRLLVMPRPSSSC